MTDIFFQSKVDEPIHILNIAIRYDKREDDDTYAETFEQFCADKVNACFKMTLDQQTL